MAAVGEATLSVSFNSLLSKLRSSEVLEIAAGNQACRKELEKLESFLSAIHAILDDAEKQQRREELLKEWLDELRHLAYDMDDILDVFATKSLARKVKQRQQVGASKVQRLISTCFTSLIPPTMMSGIQEITLQLEELAKKRMYFHLRGVDILEPITGLMRETHSFVV